jgi:hypothetical protein
MIRKLNVARMAANDGAALQSDLVGAGASYEKQRRSRAHCACRTSPAGRKTHQLSPLHQM